VSTIIDLVASFIFGGALLLIIIDADDLARENHSVYNGDMLVQEMLISTVHVLEGEFRNMGYGVPEKPTVLQADSTSITFLSDLAPFGGAVDTIRYYTGDPGELSGTQNELDRFLHRRVNEADASQVGAVTVFRLRYLTRSGEILSTPVQTSRLSEIHVVEVTVEVQNPYAPLRREGEIGEGERNALYSTTLWQQTRLASQNSRR
jgi:hypothetical protein